MLQIRRVTGIIQYFRDNCPYFPIFCDPSLEPPCQDSSNEGDEIILIRGHNMFLLRNKKNYL